MPAKLTSCVVWPQAIGGVAVPAKVKVTFRAGAMSGPAPGLMVPVKVTVPNGSGPAKVAAKLKAGRVLCTLAAPERGRRTLILPSP